MYRNAPSPQEQLQRWIATSTNRVLYIILLSHITLDYRLVEPNTITAVTLMK
jgi:hypothetical protein